MNDPLLVAEDDANIRDVMRLELAAQGFNVETVASGEDAVRFLEKRPARLVLLDFRMPGMDGLETALAIKRRWPDIPIVLCTVVEQKRLAGYLGKEIAAFLPKPFTFQRLKETVAGALSQADPA